MLKSSAVNTTKCLALILLCSLASTSYAIKIVTTIKPLHSIASKLTDNVDGASVKLLIDNQVSAHHYTIKPSDRLSIAKADLIYWISPDIESSFARVFANMPSASELATIDNITTYELRESAGHDDHHDHGHHSEEKGHDKDHESEAIDAHIWLSPDNAKVIAMRMAQDLSKIDPSNKAQYLNNAKEFSQDLDALKANIAKELSPNTKVATFHDAFQYFEKAFSLQFVEGLSLHPNLPLSGKQRLAIDKTIKDAKLSCLFYDPSHHPKAATQLAQQRDTNDKPVRIIALDPMGYRLEANQDLYILLLKNLAKDITSCQS